MKVGRNLPCPCGSGRKFKLCCIGRYPLRASPPAPALVERARAHHEEVMRAEAVRHETFGEVGPILHAGNQERRLVAVGNRVFFDRPEHNRRWNTFTDFLIDYIRTALGIGWGQREIKKPLEERHPILQWWAHFCTLQQTTAERATNGMYSMSADGITSAYLHLAYDLYVLDKHQKLQKEVLRRLRITANFPGARYELLVAATFIRAGCTILYEDERDPSRRHPEFVATHTNTGAVFAVEAKAKHRTIAVPPPPTRPKARVKDLLLDAATKETVLPYVVFVDLNLPPDVNGPPSWAEEVIQMAFDVIATVGHCPFDMIVFTNIPHQYGEMGGPEPARHYWFWTSRAVRPSRLPIGVEEAIVRAVTQYDNIPKDLPAEATVRRLSSPN